MNNKISIRSRLEYFGVTVLAAICRVLPLSVVRGIATGISWILSRILKLRQNVALDNLRQSFPEKSESELHDVYSRCWKHLVRVGFEMARLPRMNKRFIDRWIDLAQHTAFTEAFERGKGAIVVSGHFGNWEWMGGCMTILGYSLSYVVTSQANPLVEKWLDSIRRSAGAEIIPRRDAARGVLKALKRNRAVAILCDQDAGDAGVFVPFFNRPASTPRGPALFHLKTGAPIFFGTAHCDQNGRYHVKFEAMHFNNLTGERMHDEKSITAQITEQLESEIRQHPEQWLWLHRRWKTKPSE